MLNEAAKKIAKMSPGLGAAGVAGKDSFIGHAASAGIGSVAGAAGAYMSGGNIMTGALMGAGAGFAGAEYGTDIRKATFSGARHLKKAGGGNPYANKAAQGMRMWARGSRKSVARQNGIATAAGLGLASGVMLSGHKRNSVSRFNGNRGNQIGR